MEIATKDDVLDGLARAYEGFSPQLRKAAQYVLDNPNDIGVHSIRQVADAADVHPNTLVRMAGALGFDGYRQFRKPFSDHLRQGVEGFPDRARWLQSIAESGRHGTLYAEIAEKSFANVETLYAAATAEDVKTAADLIVASRTTYVLGVGTAYALAHNFWYVARMAFENIVQVPRTGVLAIDEVARMGPDDVLLAMTFRPYRAEVVEAAQRAVARGVKLVAVTDSRASPIATAAEHAFIVPTEASQFFTSMVGALAFLETLIAFMIADADKAVIDRIEDLHRLRLDAGIYFDDGL